jgi:DNA polymerase I
VFTHLTCPADVLGELRIAEVARGSLLSVVLGSDALALASDQGTWVISGADPVATVTTIAEVEAEFRPRWVWWTSEGWEPVLRSGLRVATCWDLAAVHRLLFGGWRAEPARGMGKTQRLIYGHHPRYGTDGFA